MQDKLRNRRMDLERMNQEVIRREQMLKELEMEVAELQDGLVTYTIPNDLSNVKAEDFMDMVHRLKNRLRLQEMRNNLLMRERLDYMLLCRQMDRELEDLDILYCQIQAVSGAHMQEALQNKYGLAHSEQDVAIKELYFLSMVLKKELYASKTLVARKEEVILRFLNDVDDVNTKREEQNAMRNELNTMDNNIKEIDGELADLEAQHRRMDASVVSGERRVAAMRAPAGLMLDTTLLRSKVDEAAAIRRKKETQAKLQARRLELTQTRLGVINSALTDLKLKNAVDKKLRRSVLDIPAETLPVAFEDEPQERVPVELYELLARHKEAIESSAKLKDILIREKQGTIESSEKLMAEVREMGEEEVRKQEEVVSGYQRKIAKLSKEVTEDREVLQGDLYELQKGRRQKKVKYEKVVKKVQELSRYAEGLRLRGSPLRSPRTPSRTPRGDKTPTPTPRSAKGRVVRHKVKFSPSPEKP